MCVELPLDKKMWKIRIGPRARFSSDRLVLTILAFTGSLTVPFDSYNFESSQKTSSSLAFEQFFWEFSWLLKVIDLASNVAERVSRLSRVTGIFLIAGFRFTWLFSSLFLLPEVLACVNVSTAEVIVDIIWFTDDKDCRWKSFSSFRPFKTFVDWPLVVEVAYRFVVVFTVASVVDFFRERDLPLSIVCTCPVWKSVSPQQKNLQCKC